MIKRWMVISTAFLITFAAIPLYAGQYAHSLGVSFKYSYRDYKEINEPEWFKSNEAGFLPGIHVSYSYAGIKNPLYVRLLFEHTEGKTDYDGALQDGTPAKGKTNNRFNTWEGNMGFTLKPWSSELPFSITFYTGFGYRYWNRGLGGQYPYSEEYSWKYIPVGLRGAYRMSEKWTVEVDIAAWFIFDGEIKVNLSEANSNYNNSKTALGNKMGWKIEIPLNYQLSNHWSLNLVPSYENYSFGKGDKFIITYAGMPTEFVGYEPDSRTSIYSIRLGVKFHF